jgi:2-dehydropantoate 2-reductase
MNILLIGAGIIGSIYGWALANAKHGVTHLVRPGRADFLRDGIRLDMLDKRKGHPRRFRGTYLPRTIESVEEAGQYDLVIFPGHHYTLPEVLADIVPQFPNAGFLFMTQNWTGTEAIDAVLPRSRYIFGDAKAGGSWRDGVLVGAIHSVDIGPIDASGDVLTETIRSAFSEADIPVTVQPKMLEYLWVQFALSGGMWPALVEAASFGALLGDGNRLAKALAALRECLSLVEARGVDLGAYPEVSIYRSAKGLKIKLAAVLLRVMFSLSEWSKRVSSHALSSAEEIKAFYNDILGTAKTMGIPMPVFESYRSVIDAFRPAMVH